MKAYCTRPIQLHTSSSGSGGSILSRRISKSSSSSSKVETCPAVCPITYASDILSVSAGSAVACLLGSAASDDKAYAQLEGLSNLLAHIQNMKRCFCSPSCSASATLGSAASSSVLKLATSWGASSPYSCNATLSALCKVRSKTSRIEQVAKSHLCVKIIILFHFSLQRTVEIAIASSSLARRRQIVNLRLPAVHSHVTIGVDPRCSALLTAQIIFVNPSILINPCDRDCSQNLSKYFFAGANHDAEQSAQPWHLS